MLSFMIVMRLVMSGADATVDDYGGDNDGDIGHGDHCGGDNATVDDYDESSG